MRSVVALLMLFTIFSGSALAQGTLSWSDPGIRPVTPWSTSGHDFYACFLSVVGDYDLDASTVVRALFLTSRAPTHATVEVLQSAIHDTVLIEPGVATRVDLPAYVALGRSEYELPMHRVVHVHSDELISVYGFAHNSESSDGFFCLSADGLGTRYAIATLRNAINYPPDAVGSPNPRGEIGIIATADNTTIQIKLKATSFSGRMLADSIYTINLSRGSLYQIMAKDAGSKQQYDPKLPDCDLTGSFVWSDKPIAVFAGHERAASPSKREYDSSATRDHLIEQMPPVESWGKSYVIPSSAPGPGEMRPNGGDMVRIISAVDSATVTIDGKQSVRIGAGKYYEFMAGAVCTVTADTPVMVVKYMQDASTSTGIGDPDMTVVRPVEYLTTSYSLPGAHDAYTFPSAHLLVMCDTGCLRTTTRNGNALPVNLYQRIPNSSFAYGVFTVDGRSQHVESPKPCYAELYGFGKVDSYTYVGGGEFHFTDSLFTQDLDFQSVLCNSSKDLATIFWTNSSRDTVLVYGYQWSSGDTTQFALLDGVPQPLRVAPGGRLPLPIRFNPVDPRKYSARLRVWSSAPNDVFVQVSGAGVVPGINVFPDTIDFGRTRFGTRKDSLFTIQNTGTSKLTLTQPRFSTYTFGTYFSAEDLPGLNFLLDPGASVTVPVHFVPFKNGVFRDTVLVWSDDPRRVNKPDTVILIGQGVEPNLISRGRDFGVLRVGSQTSRDTITIRNVGTDVLMIDSVRILDSTDISNFAIELDTLPVAPARFTPLRLGYGPGDSLVRFSVAFTPTSLGRKTLRIAIYSIERTLIDTITGVGAEPLVQVTPQVLNFGTVQVTKLNTPTAVPLDFTVSNSGTWPAYLSLLSHTDKEHFTVLLDKPDSVLVDTLRSSASLAGTATFLVTEEGDFIDTVWVHNDTRYSLYGAGSSDTMSMVVLKAKVRTGPIDPGIVSFDTISSCAPVAKDLLIHNPYPVEIHIDSIQGVDIVSGFSYATSFGFPINIPSNGDYPLHLQYVFPNDSLNGDQITKLILYQRRGGGETPIPVVDTVTLVRKQRVLTLHALLPSFVFSASDLTPLRMPITIEGPRDAVPELNTWTLDLIFSNDLFEPIDVDNTGGLAQPQDPAYPLTWKWHPDTRTLSIRAIDVNVSDPTKLWNKLLLTVVMRAYLTTDTSVTVTPIFTFDRHPCAYNLQPFTLSIPYADECGDATLRQFMEGSTPAVTLLPVQPNPSPKSGKVVVRYVCAKAGRVVCTVSNSRGEVTGSIAEDVKVGEGSLSVPAEALPSSGVAFLDWTMIDPSGALLLRRTMRLSVEP